MSDNEHIALYTPEVTKEELLEAVSATYESGVYTRGNQVKHFEEKLADITGHKEALAVSNGTTALNLAVRASGWHKGDKVITSPMSFIATTNVLLQEGLIPVFADLDENLQLDWVQAKEIIEKDPTIKGILMPVIYGRSVDVEAVRDIKYAHPEVFIIEDAAQALAPVSRGLGVGDGADITTFSFHENKVITTMGEGGGVISNDAEHIERMRRMREQGRLDTPNWIDLVELGYNYRMTEAQAHTGTAQLNRLDAILDRRAELAHRMGRQLLESGIPLSLPLGDRSWFAYPVVADGPEAAAHLARTMNSEGIQSRVKPMPAIQSFNHVARSLHEDYARDITSLADSVVLLPLHTKLNEVDIDRIVESAKKAFYKKIGNHCITSSSAFYDSLAKQYSQVRAERKNYLHAVNQIVINEIANLSGYHPHMLDVGCGDGVRGSEIATSTGYTLTAIDSSDEMVTVARSNGVNAMVGDIVMFDERLVRKGKFGVISLLWNVLGHIPSDQLRLDALNNIYTLLANDGILVLDVNNQFNAAQYGADNAERNRKAVRESVDTTTVGDFVTERIDEQGRKFSTVSHIFHTDEVESLLERAGFKVAIQYVHYGTGEHVDESSGQIIAVAKKTD